MNIMVSKNREYKLSCHHQLILIKSLCKNSFSFINNVHTKKQNQQKALESEKDYKHAILANKSQVK